MRRARRRLAGAPAALVALPLAFGACGPAPLRPPPERPHVLLVVADDLGRGDVGWLGSEIRTPTLDRLAAEGVELDAFYAQHMCSPSRAALFTGRYPYRYGMQTGNLRPWTDVGLRPEERLLPELLREVGYATHLVGKWHLGAARVELLPTRRGFDHHYGPYFGMVDHFTHEREGALDWHRDERPASGTGYSTHLLRDEAVRVVRAHDPATPLFLALAFTAPHAPLQAPADELERYASIADLDRRAYAAMVTCLDEAVGDVLRALEERGMLADTLRVFVSDNGANEDEGGSNGGLRGGKNVLYEGGVRVPALVAWPGVLPPGRVEVPLHVVDLLPTIAARAGVRRNITLDATGAPVIDGVDLWPLLARGAAPAREEVLLTATKSRAALRAGRFKLLVDYQVLARRDESVDPTGGLELYDVVADPGEERDLAAERPEVVERLFDRLQVHRNRRLPRREERQEELPAGYPVPEAWGPPSEQGARE